MGVLVHLTIVDHGIVLISVAMLLQIQDVDRQNDIVASCRTGSDGNLNAGTLQIRCLTIGRRIFRFPNPPRYFSGIQIGFVDIDDNRDLVLHVEQRMLVRNSDRWSLRIVRFVQGLALQIPGSLSSNDLLDYFR